MCHAVPGCIHIWGRDMPFADLRNASTRADGVQNFLYSPHGSTLKPEHPDSLKAVALFLERFSVREPIIVRGVKGQMAWTPDVSATGGLQCIPHNTRDTHHCPVSLSRFAIRPSTQSYRVILLIQPSRDPRSHTAGRTDVCIATDCTVSRCLRCQHHARYASVAVMVCSALHFARGAYNMKPAYAWAVTKCMH